MVKFWSMGTLHFIFMMKEFDYSKQEFKTVSKSVFVYPIEYSAFKFGI
jgi:hypothetical protein